MGTFTESMASLSYDCSLAAAIFAWTYTVINAVLFFTSCYTLYKFCKDYKINVKKRPPKLLFYPGVIFFVFSSLALLATVRNSMTMCYHNSTNYTDISYWVYFIVFYGAQTYLLWLVLFLRLHYVFKGSVYNLSKITVRLHAILFISIPLLTPVYIYLLFHVNGKLYTIILFLSFIFIMLFSCSLSALFIYKLFQVFKNMDICMKHRQKLINHKLLSTITKSTMLAMISLSMTLLTPITLLFGYYGVAHSNDSTVREAGACLLAFCSLFDVYTNYICILLSYNCFDKMYNKICGKCDKKCRVFCITKIMKKKSTHSGHIEISSCTSKTTVTSPASQGEHFMSVTPPNGGNGNVRHDRFVRHQYEQVDTDYEETETTLDDNRDTGITPFTHSNNVHYDIPEEDEEEEEDDDEIDENMKLNVDKDEDRACGREYTATREVKRRFLHDL